jgi:Tol biopolymer transport system component
MNSDGSDQLRLTSNSVSDNNPVWSPDGKKIVFISGDRIYIMNADGSDQTPLTNNICYWLHPVIWLP